MAFRRQAFEGWPGFSERLGPGTPLLMAEESYAFFSLVEQGHRVVYTPSAIARHPHPRTMEDLRTRYLRELASSAGYFTFLFLEQPAYRRRILKYLVEALRGTPREWRDWLHSSSSRKARL